MRSQPLDDPIESARALLLRQSLQYRSGVDTPTPTAASVLDPRTLACGKGSVFSRQRFVEDLFVQGEARYSLLQPIVLALDFLQALRLVELQATVLTTLLVVRLLRDPETAADLAHRLALPNPHFRLAQSLDDLLRRLAFPCHVRVSLREPGNSRIRIFRSVSDQECRPRRQIL